jgi:hypothetical protein
MNLFFPKEVKHAFSTGIEFYSLQIEQHRVTAVSVLINGVFPICFLKSPLLTRFLHAGITALMSCYKECQSTQLPVTLPSNSRQMTELGKVCSERNQNKT